MAQDDDVTAPELPDYVLRNRAYWDEMGRKQGVEPGLRRKAGQTCVRDHLGDQQSPNREAGDGVGADRTSLVVRKPPNNRHPARHNAAIPDFSGTWPFLCHTLLCAGTPPVLKRLGHVAHLGYGGCPAMSIRALPHHHSRSY